MALPQEAVEIQKKRDAILVQVTALKEQSRELKKQFDMIVERARLEHKFNGLSETEKAVLKEML